MNSSNEALRSTAVTKRLANGFDATGNSRIRNDAAIPNPFDNFLFRYDSIAVFDEENEQGEDLRLKRNHAPLVAELNLRRIELKVVKNIDHCVIYSVSTDFST